MVSFAWTLKFSVSEIITKSKWKQYCGTPCTIILSTYSSLSLTASLINSVTNKLTTWGLSGRSIVYLNPPNSKVFDFCISSSWPEVILESPNFHIFKLLWICVFHFVHNLSIQLNFENILKVKICCINRHRTDTENINEYKICVTLDLSCFKSTSLYCVNSSLYHFFSSISFKSFALFPIWLICVPIWM